MVVLQPFPDHRAWDGQREDPVVEARGADVAEPHRDRGFGEPRPGELEDVGPGLLRLALREGYRHANPQNLSTTVENTWGKRSAPRRSSGSGVAWSEAGRTVAHGFGPPSAPRGVLALFLLSRALSCVDGRPYTGP